MLSRVTLSQVRLGENRLVVSKMPKKRCAFDRVRTFDPPMSTCGDAELFLQTRSLVTCKSSERFEFEEQFFE